MESTMTRHRSSLARYLTVVAAALLVPGLTLLAGGLTSTASATTVGTPNSVLAYGTAAGAVANQTSLGGPVTGIAATPSGNGYWVTTAAGQVQAEGDAKNYGSMGSALNAPIIGIAATPSGNGYWLVGGDGGIFSFGGAQFFGSTGSMVLNKPVVGMASTSDGNGYWLVASDGGIFSFGDAVFHGSMGGTPLNQPVDGMAATPGGGGYWEVASDGGIFSFGDAAFHGSMGATPLVEPVVGMSATPDGGGYRMVAADGGIFNFGDAAFYGSGTGASLTAPVVGMAARPGGYWIAYGATNSLTTVLGQEEVLSGLGYGPLSWSPLGFRWRWAPQPTLAAVWSPGQDGAIARGEIMAFEAEVGLPIDGNISTPEINALTAAAADPTGPGANPNGFTYALASENSPESLTVWQNGIEVEQTPANTGGAGTPTAPGTFPVYLRYRNQIMSGTDPDGATYADPVQFVSYFNGGDALHYMPRTSYGDPQSLGCVELPYTAAETIWPYTVIGSIVTVN
jgi:hypothetical protein